MIRSDRVGLAHNKIIAALNQLIETSKDGEKELTRAAEDAGEPDLARAFSDAEEANRTASAELQDQVRLLGGTAQEEGSLKAVCSCELTALARAVSASTRDRSAASFCSAL